MPETTLKYLAGLRIRGEHRLDGFSPRPNGPVNEGRLIVGFRQRDTPFAQWRCRMLDNVCKGRVPGDHFRQRIHRPGNAECANQAPLLLLLQKLDWLIPVYKVRSWLVQQKIIDPFGVQPSQASFETRLRHLRLERLAAGQGATAVFQIPLELRDGIHKPPRHALHDTDCRHPGGRIKAKLCRHRHRISTPAQKLPQFDLGLPEAIQRSHVKVSDSGVIRGCQYRCTLASRVQPKQLRTPKS
jgi:hypothetical protein